MLLYTRLAPPKEPKRRSRGGCAYCKEKKKKCDEKRPKCGRCTEHGTECAYEAAKPRQRRRRESALTDSHVGVHPMGRRLSEASHYSNESAFGREDGIFGSFLPYSLDDPIIMSPTDTAFQGFSFASFSPTAFLEDQREDDVHEDGPPVASTAVISRPKSRNPDLAMIAPCPVGSPLLDFCVPPFAEFSDKPNRRALVDHFCNVLSHLIVFREESGNPFQQLVLPLTRRDSPVTYAIFALACAHLEYRGVENAEKSLYFHNMAIRGVAQLIQNSSKVSRNEILAAIMLLVYYECLVQKGHSNIVAGHLKGALTIMGTGTDPADSTSVFLERAFHFYDVITALSNGTPPLSAAPTPGCLQPLPPLGAPSMSPLCNVDTLLGMATTLWPIIHRLAGLRTLKDDLAAAVRAHETPSKIAVLRTEFESTAQAIEAALLQWQPQLPPNFIPDDDLDNDDFYSLTGNNPSPVDQHKQTRPPKPHHHPNHARISSIHHNALAYRSAALVHLYRAVLARPRRHPAVQAHARRALRHCAATARHAGPMSALLWPMFVAACEAVAPADRALAARVFARVDRRQGMRNIERAWGIIREVWRRGDGGAGLEAPGLGTAFPPGLGVGVVGGEGGEAGWFGAVHGEGGGPGGGGGGGGAAVWDGEEVWRTVSREMGVSIVFG